MSKAQRSRLAMAVGLLAVGGVLAYACGGRVGRPSPGDAIRNTIAIIFSRVGLRS